jgi:two-component system, cell cycle sensor histidine kinase and response regulator CckA
MKKDKGDPGDIDKLRRQAETQYLASRNGPVADDAAIPLETQRLIYELQVHQIELEMQNEELQRARTEVEEGLARYTNLYEFAPVGYFNLGRDGLIRQVNLTGARLLGLERSRLLGKRLAIFVTAECRRTFDELLTKAFEGRTQGACEVVLHSEGAAPPTVELTVVASPDVQECRVVVSDISERKQAERERAQAALQLQQIQTHSMEAIATLAGGIAHDFNNILAGLLGKLSLLELDFSETGKASSDLQDMKDLVDRAANLTKQLLGFACRGKYDVQPLDLVHVAKKASALFGRRHKDITIQLDFAPGLPAVLMDRSQLDQVLLNLLSNAAQAMPKGGLLCLRAESTQLTHEEVAAHGVAPGHFVKLVVADTGVGMDEATQARIFEPFFTTKHKGQGAGLGLASVYGILKSHAGFITVDSTLGKGATFTLFLPATDRPNTEEKTPPPRLQRGEGRKILVVDDEEMLRNVCARLLQRLGYEVLTASGGKQAVDLVRQHGKEISLVILDMVMPDMSGSQTYDALQKVAPGLKVLLCTGYSIDGQAQEIIDRGCNGFLQKPFDVATLSAKLQETLATNQT